MKSNLALPAVGLAILVAGSAGAQTVWTGPPITFVKANFADETLEENHDRMTDIVWITRGCCGGGIYNIAQENSYGAFSPIDTEWAFGSADDWQSLAFQTWHDWHDGDPPGVIGDEAVVHLITDDIYIDFEFLSWTCCGQGGGFSYERSTPEAPCPWDLDVSGSVGTADLLDLLSQWGTDPGGPPDFNDDMNVGTSDLLALLSNWGPCPK